MRYWKRVGQWWAGGEPSQAPYYQTLRYLDTFFVVWRYIKLVSIVLISGGASWFVGPSLLSSPVSAVMYVVLLGLFALVVFTVLAFTLIMWRALFEAEHESVLVERVRTFFVNEHMNAAQLDDIAAMAAVGSTLFSARTLLPVVLVTASAAIFAVTSLPLVTTLMLVEVCAGSLFASATAVRDSRRDVVLQRAVVVRRRELLSGDQLETSPGAEPQQATKAEVPHLPLPTSVPPVPPQPTPARGAKKPPRGAVKK